MGTEIPTFRPAEMIGEASRLQNAGSVLPSADSNPVRELDERRANRYGWVAIALIAAFAAFLFYVVFVLR